MFKDSINEALPVIFSNWGSMLSDNLIMISIVLILLFMNFVVKYSSR